MEKHYISKEIWEQIYLQSPIGIAIVDLDCKFLKVNNKIKTFLGYTDQEMLEMTMYDITHPRDGESEKAEIRNIKEGFLPGYEIFKRIITKHGRVEWVKQTMWPVRDDVGNILNFVTHIQPLVNGNKDKIENIENIEAYEKTELHVRPTLTLREFVLDNWKSFIAALIFIISTCITCGVAFNKALNEIELQKKVQLRQQEIIEKLNDRLYYKPSDNQKRAK